MILYPKPITDITEDDLQNLISNQVAENKYVEYKETLPGSSDEEKKEFLADVSSFANTVGGLLIYGMQAENGLPVELRGFENINPDAEKLRLESIIRDGLAPRIPGIFIHSLQLQNGNHLIVIRVPQSYSAPHMVIYKNSSRFYARNSAGKYQMDVHELRRAFVLTEAVGDKIRDFRMERVARIAAGDTPVPLIHQDRFKLILHVIPYSSFAVSQVLDLQTCTQSARKYLQPTTLVRFNLDGLVTYLNAQDNLAGWYYQIFHHGQIECVYVGRLIHFEKDVLLPSREIENTIVDGSWNCTNFLQELNVEPPLFIFLSLVGVKDTRLATEKYPIYFNNAKFDRDPVLIPEVLLETYPSTKEEIPQILKPLRDAMWNASGFDQSPY